MIFLLDMDGVIADFVSGLIKLHGWPIEHGDYANWDYHREFGITDDEMWEPTYDGSFWLSLDPYPWASALIRSLRNHGEVIYCTSPSKDATCPSQKVSWLRAHGFMGINEVSYQIGKRKELNAGSGAVLIDDSDSNILKYRGAGGRAILFPQPWNENRRSSNDPAEYVIDIVEEMFPNNH